MVAKIIASDLCDANAASVIHQASEKSVGISPVGSKQESSGGKNETAKSDPNWKAPEDCLIKLDPKLTNISAGQVKFEGKQISASIPFSSEHFNNLDESEVLQDFYTKLLEKQVCVVPESLLSDPNQITNAVNTPTQPCP